MKGLLEEEDRRFDKVTDSEKNTREMPILEDFSIVQKMSKFLTGLLFPLKRWCFSVVSLRWDFQLSLDVSYRALDLCRVLGLTDRRS